jgi:hypothetical protein
MDLSKSIAWVAFAAIVGATGLGKDEAAAGKPAAKPADSRPLKTHIAQRESHKMVVGPVSDRPVQILRTSAP